MAKETARRDARLAAASEPMLGEDDDWVEYGGELILRMGSTSGGAPYGVTLDEMREIEEREARDAGWARAKALLAEIFEAASPGGARVEVGFVTKVGDGLSRELFAAHVDVAPGSRALSGEWAVALARRDAIAGLDDRVRTELRVLGWLESRALPFRVPRALGAMRERGGGLALVRQCMPGIPLDLRRELGTKKPWDAVATAAAPLHALEVADLPSAVAGHATRRAHAQAALASLEGLDEAEIRDALAWANANLPPDSPATLLHGDLLGQNLLIDPSEEPWLAVIDWEYARRGDPAYDLAIVTRGAREPFRRPDGLERLLAAYAEHGGVGVRREHVGIHELALHAAWYRESLRGEGSTPPDQALARFRNVVRRAQGARSRGGLP